MSESFGNRSARWKNGRFWKRQFAITIPIAILLILLTNWWTSRPFKTLQRFGVFVEARQFDDAIRMIANEDRKKIPAGYWEQFHHAQLEVGASPTPITLIDGRMAVFIAFREPDSKFFIGSGIHFVIDREVVHVHEVSFRETH